MTASATETGAAPDLSHSWLHVTDMAAFARDPLVFRSGEGIAVTDADGRAYVDAVSAAMVTSLGYDNAHVRRALDEQAGRLPFWPLLHGANEPAVELAARLCALLPGDLDRAFLLSGGSEATETAMKLARQYHVIAGRPQKTKVVARYLSYHGATKGALAASGLRDKAVFEPLAPNVVHVLPPDRYRCPFGDLSPAACESAAVEAIERTIAYEGRGTVAAVIADPIMAGAGVIVPSRAYYERLREICGDDVLLIFDEVLCGCGRLGSFTAAEHYGVTPDLICLGKGLSAGFAPLAATVARRPIADAFDAAGAVFQHIHTFGGNPLSAAVGLAVLDELERRDLVANAAAMGARMLAGLRAIAQRNPHVGDVRGLGLLAGVELVADAATRRRFAQPPGPLVVDHARREEGLLLRASRDVVQLAPPLIVDTGQVDDILARTERAIDAVCRRLTADQEDR